VAPDRGRDTQQHGRGPASAVPAQVQPVLAPDCQRADGLLGRAVVDRQPPVGEVDTQGGLLVGGVRDGLHDRGLRQHPQALAPQPVGERGQDRTGVLRVVSFAMAETDEGLEIAAPIVVEGELVVIRHPARGEFRAVVELQVREARRIR